MQPVAVRILRRFAQLVTAGANVRAVEFLPSGDPSEFPAVQIEDEGEEIVSQDWLATRSRLQVSVIGYVSDRFDAWAQAREIDAGIIRAVMSDDTYGGLATLTEHGGLVIERIALANVSSVAFSRDYVIDFSYQTNDPAKVAG